MASILIPIGIASLLACSLIFVMLNGKPVEDDSDHCGWADTHDDPRLLDAQRIDPDHFGMSAHASSGDMVKNHGVSK